MKMGTKIHYIVFDIFLLICEPALFIILLYNISSNYADLILSIVYQK
jgi:hypothetical protein